MTAHAKFSPSSAHRWIPCPGSIVLEGQLPQERTSTRFADEGTAAHSIAALILEGSEPGIWLGQHWHVDADGVTRTFSHKEMCDSIQGGNRGIVDQAFLDAVMVYVNYVRDLAADGYDTFVEQRVELSSVLGAPDQFGTSDFIAANEAKRHMHVADLKFGMGERVDATENYQGMLYALGALHEMEVLYGADAFDTVTIHICQPRIDHIDEWMVSVEDLRAFGRKAAEAVQRAEGARCSGGREEFQTYLSPSDKACRWCKVKSTCPAYGRLMSEIFFQDCEALDAGRVPAMALASQAVADDEVLSRRYAAADMLEQLAKEVRAEAERRVAQGRTVIGPDGQPLKFVQGREGNRAWSDKQAAEAVLVGVLPPEKAYKPREIISVAEAEKALKIKKPKKGSDKVDPRWAPFLPFISRAEGKPTLVLGSDPRPALESLAPAASGDEFAAVETEDPLCS